MRRLGQPGAGSVGEERGEHREPVGSGRRAGRPARGYRVHDRQSCERGSSVSIPRSSRIIREVRRVMGGAAHPLALVADVSTRSVGRRGLAARHRSRGRLNRGWQACRPALLEHLSNDVHGTKTGFRARPRGSSAVTVGCVKAPDLLVPDGRRFCHANGRQPVFRW